VQQLLLRLRPEATDLADPLGLERGAQVFEIAHAQLRPEAEQRLGPEPGNPAQLDELGRVLPPELLDLGDRPALEELPDLLRGARADAVDRGQLLLGERLQVAPV
jgi:hypothetical protein